MKRKIAAAAGVIFASLLSFHAEKTCDFYA